MAVASADQPDTQMVRIYVGGISYSTSEEKLLQEARKFADQAKATIIMDRMTGRSKGFGFVEVPEVSAAVRFIESFNGKELDGWRLGVSMAKPIKPRAPRTGGWQEGFLRKPLTDNVVRSSVIQSGGLVSADLIEHFALHPEEMREMPRTGGWQDDALLLKPLADIVVPPAVIQLGGLVSADLIEYFALHPEEMRKMPHRKFEELVAEIFSRFGYEVELTKQTRDGGIDIIAIRNAEVRTRFLIQCKRLTLGNKVSVEPVRELLGVKHDLGASKGIIATRRRRFKRYCMRRSSFAIMIYAVFRTLRIALLTRL